MKIVIDIGNTATKIGVFEGDNLLEVKVCQPFTRADISCLKEKYKIDTAILCTVTDTPEWIEDEMAGIPVMLWNTAFSNVRYPIKCSCNEHIVGRDRIAIAVGLSVLYPKKSVLAISLGSCITYNLLTEEKILIPGAISPGLTMRFKAMHEFTYALPIVDMKTYKHLLNSPIDIIDTETSILSGVTEGVFFEIDGFIDRYRSKYGQIPVVITGGDSAYFEFSPKKMIFASPKLLLIGLNEILEYNK